MTGAVPELEPLEDRLEASGSGLPDGDDKRLTAALRAAEAAARGPAPVPARPTPLPAVRVGDVLPGKGVPPLPPPPGALPPVAPVPLIEKSLMLANHETDLGVSLNTKLEDEDPKRKFWGAFDTRSGRWVSFLRPRPTPPQAGETRVSGEMPPLAEAADDEVAWMTFVAGRAPAGPGGLRRPEAGGLRRPEAGGWGVAPAGNLLRKEIAMKVITVSSVDEVRIAVPGGRAVTIPAGMILDVWDVLHGLAGAPAVPGRVSGPLGELTVYPLMEGWGVSLGGASGRGATPWLAVAALALAMAGAGTEGHKGRGVVV
jgi:hypothetical protein